MSTLKDITLKQYEEIENAIKSIDESFRRNISDGNGNLDEAVDERKWKDFLANIERLSKLASDIGKQKLLNTAPGGREAYLSAHRSHDVEAAKKRAQDRTMRGSR